MNNIKDCDENDEPMCTCNLCFYSDIVGQTIVCVCFNVFGCFCPKMHKIYTSNKKTQNHGS